LFVVPESFGLVAGLLILAILIPTFMIMDAAFRSPARGLYVSIAKPLNGATPVVPGAEPPLVYVSANGKLFLNSRQISRSGLPAAIRQELARRADPLSTWRENRTATPDP
jgi:biopolymer transport protein ExbD